jgi:hypothetical protein
MLREMLAFRLAVLERFRAEHVPGLDPGMDIGSREENASNQKLERDGFSGSCSKIRIYISLTIAGLA